MKPPLFIVLAVCGPLVLWAQSPQTKARDYDQEIQEQSQAIEALKQQIEQTRRRIAAENEREASVVKRVSGMEQEISLLDRLISELRREENQTRRRIQTLSSQIAENQAAGRRLRQRYALRVVRAYKRGTLSSLEKVLSSNTWRQALYRIKYLRIISDYDRNLYRQLQDLLQQIESQKAELERVLAKNTSLNRERRSKIEDLRGKKQEREKELKKIRNNKSLLQEQLAEQQAGMQQLEEIVQQLLTAKESLARAERIRKQQEQLQMKNFAALKGQLPWPAEGRIINRFGRQWNAKLKTTTENPGVEIKGKPGSPVRAILGGVVTTITYIRGYGTTIIIDHGGGYYTVYSHVNRIEASVDSEVRPGDIIAYMSDSGSVEGSKLHFEIWGQGQKLDPEAWLKIP